jgi:GT2 family glycosyltransferase
LDSLIRALQSLPGSNEIFVVDNGSVDGSVEILTDYEKEYPGLVNPIFFEKNMGTTFSRNTALKRANGDFLLVLDSDAYVDGKSLHYLVAYLGAHRAYGMAVPRLYYASGNYQMSCDVFPTLLHKIKRFLLLRTMESRASLLQSTTEAVDVDYAISACWMIRRDAFSAVGLFDENIFYSPEDVDFCLRMWEAGYRIAYVPKAEVVHDAQELSRGFRLSRFHFSHLSGLFYLMRKHRYFWGLNRLYRRINRFG